MSIRKFDYMKFLKGDQIEYIAFNPAKYTRTNAEKIAKQELGTDSVKFRVMYANYIFSERNNSETEPKYYITDNPTYFPVFAFFV